MRNQLTLEGCMQLSHRFFHHLDEQRYDELLAMLEPDAVWHRQGLHPRGHAQIRAALDQRSPTQRIRHVLTNGFIESGDDDAVHYVAYMIGYRHDDGAVRQPPLTIAGPLRMLLVDMRFARQADGGWLIRELAAIPEFEFAQAS